MCLKVLKAQQIQVRFAICDGLAAQASVALPDFQSVARLQQPAQLRD
jgi:hypothetical protein